MTKRQEKSLQRLRQAIQIIQELAPKELQRFSQRRKHDMENAYTTLRLHAEKLGTQVPALSTYYNPQEYLDKANALERQLVVWEIPQDLSCKGR